MGKFCNVFIVDDDYVSNFICHTLLSRNHFSDHIYICRSADSGLRSFGEAPRTGNKRNLVLLDIVMPGKDGFRFMEELNDAFPEHRAYTDVCVLTNSDSQKDLERMLKLGIQFWFNKPLRKENLTSFETIQV